MSRFPVRSLVIATFVLAPLASWAQPPATPPATVPPTQTPPAVQAPAPPKPSPPRLLSLPGQAVNVRIEVTITDQQSGEAPVQKTVALVLADRSNGMVRSESWLRSAGSTPRSVGSVPLHIDAEAALVANDRVFVQIGVEYNLPGVAEAGQPPPDTRGSEIRESIRAILQDGKPLVVSESADPITDRKVKVEVKATILR